MKALHIALKMIDRPGEAFAEVAERPRSWWLPAGVIFASLVALAWVAAPYQVALANERLGETLARLSATLSEEQMALVRARSTMTVPRYLLSAIGLGGGSLVIGWLLRAGILHVSALALGYQGPWGKVFAAIVWSALPFFVRNALQAILIFAHRQIIAHEGLSFLVASGDWLADSRNLGYAFLAQVDPFVVWHLVLLTVGLAAVTGLTRRKTGLMALLVWLLFVALKLVPVAISASFTRGLMGS